MIGMPARWTITRDTARTSRSPDTVIAVADIRIAPAIANTPSPNTPTTTLAKQGLAATGVNMLTLAMAT